MGFTSAGQIAINSWNGTIVSLIGPTLLTWTHAVTTYSPKTGQRLFINGTQFGNASDPYNFVVAAVPTRHSLDNTVVNSSVCATGPIRAGQYSGFLDKFQLYARQLSESEIATLAHP